VTVRPIACLLAIMLSACSLGITAPQPGRKRMQTPVCDSGKGLVAIDTLAAIGFGVGGLAALSDDQGTGAVALVGSALFTAAALHGSSNADKCRDAFAEYQKETAEVAAQEEVRRPRKKRAVRRDDDDDEPADQQTVAPVVPMPPRHTQPDPAPAVPAPAPAPAPAPKKPKLDDWSQFWREVP
jgi:hypothetical protein